MPGLIRVFPRRTSFTPTDDMAFVGEPPLDRPEADEVHVSCVFTWDIPTARRLQLAWAQYYPVVKLGGPAIDGVVDGFVPGRYIREGVTFTSRGCNHRCRHCLVPEREGKFRILSDISPGWIIQDNNVLQGGMEHLRRVIAMLRQQNRAVTFSGGLEAALVTQDVVDLLRTIKVNELYLACDSPANVSAMQRAATLLTPHFGRRQLRCYVLIGPNQEASLCRLECCWDYGLLPFAQLFQPADRLIEYSPEWRHLAREWSRPAAMFASHARAKTCQQREI